MGVTLTANLGVVATSSTGAKTITGLSVALTPGLYMGAIHGDGSASQPTLGIVTGEPMTGYWAFSDDGVNWENQGYYQFYTSATFASGAPASATMIESGSTVSTRYWFGMKWNRV